MNYKISTDRKRLTILANAEDRERIKLVIETGENEQGVTCDLSDILEPIVCNSELEWISEGATGDLTSAPMLGILGEVRPYFHRDKGLPHVYAGPNLIQEIVERWAFMDYQVRSVLEDLRDKGEAVFIS